MTKNNEAVSNVAAQEDSQEAAPRDHNKLNDYTFVNHKARIACYDDPLSEPRIVEVPPAPTREFLTNLAQTIWQQVRNWDSPIPYAVIADVSENFIHAQFSEMVVSIFDHGNTIRFSDQGPGIPHKEQAQEWGFSTATEPMKEYIHGVGSGLPRVKEFLACKNGTITIEDNLGSGAVVTISFNKTDDNFDEGYEDESDDFETPLGFLNEGINGAINSYTYPAQAGFQQAYPSQEPYFNPYPTSAIQTGAPYPSVIQGYPQPYTQGYPQQYQTPPLQSYYQGSTPTAPVTQGYYPVQPTPLTQPPLSSYATGAADPRALASNLTRRDCQVLLCFSPGAYLRNKEIEDLCGLSASTVNNSLKKIENQGLVKKLPNKSRVLTDLGVSVVTYLRQNSGALR